MHLNNCNRVRLIMKVNSKILMLFLGVMACDASANQDGYYVGLGLGKSNAKIPYGGDLPSGKYGGASVYSFVLGRQFNEKIAFELDASYRGDFVNNDRNYDTDDGVKKVGTSISSLSVMLNGYYYYYSQSAFFKPYILGGLGVSSNKTENMVVTWFDQGEALSRVTSGASSASFAWKLGAGVKFALDSCFDLDLRYQFVDLGNVKLGNSVRNYYEGSDLGSDPVTPRSNKMRSQEFLVGVIYKF